METAHESCFRHGVTGVDFVVFCQKVLSLQIEAEILVKLVVHRHVPEGKGLLGGLLCRDGGVKSVDVLYTGRQIPSLVGIVGTDKSLMFGRTYDRIVPVKVAVIGI